VTGRLVTARELSELLGLAPATVLDKWERGELPGYKIGRAVRFDPEEILALSRREKRPSAEEKLSTTPRAPGRGVVSLTSTTPLRGGEDA
jgi:excisionase family DNA binding protein